MDQIKERCIYCGSDVYYTGAEALIKCGMCGHTLIVAKFENELTRMNLAIEEGEQAKKDLAEAEKARQDAEVRLQDALENFDNIKDSQDVLSLLLQSVMAEQDTAEGKLSQVRDITDRILKEQGDIIEGMAIFSEIRDKLQEIGINGQAQKEFAREFVNWFQNVHDDDICRMEQIRDLTSSILAEQKEISDKIDQLSQTADRTQKTLDEFRNEWKESQLEELRQLYRQAQNYQFDRAYDKAWDKYEQIVTKGGGDAAVLWHMILCHYCVSYQENDDGEMIPIIMNPDLTDPDEMSLRLDFESMLSDRQLVPEEQAQIYRHELGKIDSILDEYRHVKHQEKYDIFISVKQDEDGHFTYDSDVAGELYHFLTSKGYKVFNSRISKIPAGEKYEPYIISALLSARVMIVVGTSGKNMNAAWVKNEWSRFQWIRESEKRSKGETERLLLCYLAKPMQPRDIPRALNPNRQAIVEGVVSGEILMETLDEVFKRKGLNQKEEPAVIPLGKKQPKPAEGNEKPKKDIVMPAVKPEKSEKDITKPAVKPEKPEKDIVKPAEGKEKPEKDILKPAKAPVSPKLIFGIAAAAVLVIVFAVSRIGGNREINEPETESESVEYILGEDGNEYVAGKVYSQCVAALPDGRDFTLITLSYPGGHNDVFTAANGAGCVIRSVNAGYAGDVPAMVGFSRDGIITGVYLPENKEVQGTGAEATEYYRDNQSLFQGEIPENGEFVLSKTGGSDKHGVIDAVSGATVTSEAIVKDVNTAIKAFSYLGTSYFDEYYGEEDDHAIDWKDENLEKAMREITGITDREIMYSDVKDLTELNLSDREISDISSLADLKNLTVLNLRLNDIHDISSLSELTGLTELDLSSNPISSIAVLSNFTNLKELELYHSSISDISSLENLIKLEVLDLDENDISDISCLGNLTKLQDLGLYGNNISDISCLGNLKEMKSLDIRSNNISDIQALESLTNLERLLISGNALNDISSLAGLKNLKTLWMSKTTITDLSPLGSLYDLTDLEISENNCEDISVLSSLTNLTKLKINQNKITDISAIGNLTKMDRLFMGHNEISDISSLSRLTDLTLLWVEDNNISDISVLSDLKALTDLNLEYNKIKDIRVLAGFQKLDTLKLRGNPIEDYSPIEDLEAEHLYK